jgi:putative endonuclease
MSNQLTGRWGEDLAVSFLERKGYKIVEKNFKTKMGEIDLIAQDGKMLCFIEVKARKTLTCGMPYESVHYYKQRKIINVALSYLKFKRLDVFTRFDVVSIYKNSVGEAQIEHIVNAFEVT